MSADDKTKRDASEARRNARTTDGSDHVSRTTRRAGFERSYPRANDPQRWNGVTK